MAEMKRVRLALGDLRMIDALNLGEEIELVLPMRPLNHDCEDEHIQEFEIQLERALERYIVKLGKSERFAVRFVSCETVRVVKPRWFGRFGTKRYTQPRDEVDYIEVELDCDSALRHMDIADIHYASLPFPGWVGYSWAAFRDTFGSLASRPSLDEPFGIRIIHRGWNQLDDRVLEYYAEVLAELVAEAVWDNRNPIDLVFLSST